jgi:hypothetical protein
MPKVSVETVQLIELSVAKKTLEQYKNRIEIIEEHMRQQGITTFDTDSFAQFLVLRFPKPTYSTVDGYRAAVQFFQQARGLWTEVDGIWSASWQCKHMTAGLVYRGKQGTAHLPQRGQVEPQMFADMMRIARKRHREVAPALELAYRIALRPHEVMSLHKGSYQEGQVLIPDKRARASNRRSILTRKAVLDETAKEILEGFENKPKAGSYWTFDITKFRTTFKEIAAELGWNTENLLFDGPHCFRHGGMAHLDALLADTSAGEKLRQLQVCEETRRRYTRPNKDRT